MMTQPPIRKNEEYPGTAILSVTGEGMGVCRIKDMVVFVPQTAAGDVCTVRIVKVLSHYAYGIASDFVSLSDSRVDPDCPVYHQCGGCCFRHLNYETELAIKESVVHDAFLRIGGIRAPMDPILPSPRTDGYRNKAQYPVGEENGKMIYGFYANRSHRIIPSDRCALQPAVFSDIASYSVSLLEKAGVLPYNEVTGKGELRHLYIRTGEASGEIQVCFVTAEDITEKVRPCVNDLISSFPLITSVLLNINAFPGNVILGEQCITLYGTETIKDTLCGNDFLISPLSFYQINHSQTENLYSAAIDYAELSGGETILDLYCGIGTIGISMAGKCKKLFGGEIVPSAVENAKKNALLNGIRNADFYCGDVAAISDLLIQKRVFLDVVVLDPPRKGCAPAVIEHVSLMYPEKIVMISCNPSTAARDCALFEKKGYIVKKYRAIDMFPRTKHVETVVLMTRTDHQKD